MLGVRPHGQPEFLRVLVLPGAAQPLGQFQHQRRIDRGAAGQRRDQGAGGRVVALQRQPRLGGRALRRVQPGDLAAGGPADRAVVGPGQAVEAPPLVGGGQALAPLADEGELGAGVGDARSARPAVRPRPRPARARRWRRPWRSAAWTAPRAPAGGRRSPARCGRRARRPSPRTGGGTAAPGSARRVVGHERGDLRRVGRARRQQAVIQHQLARHRVGRGGGQGVGVRPAAVAQGGADLVRPRRAEGRQGRHEQDERRGRMLTART